VWTVNPAAGYQPQVNFQLNCMGCHLADGSGEPGRVPSLRRSLLLLSSLPSGRDYIIRVPGVAQSSLSNEETAALLNWMARNLSDLKPPPGFVDYSAAEIERSRARPLARVGEMRARLLKAAAAIPPQ
jgi:mono/diheme cytochrome c family protein